MKKMNWHVCQWGYYESLTMMEKIYEVHYSLDRELLTQARVHFMVEYGDEANQFEDKIINAIYEYRMARNY